MKVPYKIDLPRQQAQCSHNYARLLKLLPDLDNRERWAIALDSGEMEIQVHERARYTTTLSVSQRDSALTLWSQALTLTVRLYHDADMAEVVAWDHHRQLQPRYSYPNRDMYHEDEKSQFNHFLGDWLSHSLGCGRAVETVNISQ
jgi:uncharacterized protein YqiB (DUF1249 family)|tara:strand:+ start:61 stop:495 length:435 start_codon:yes stop_codon:yes gene_type:complete